MKIATFSQSPDRPPTRTAWLDDHGASWVRFGRRLLVFADDAAWATVARHAESHGWEAAQQPRDVNQRSLYLVAQKGRLFQQAYPHVRVLLDSGRFLAVELSDNDAREFAPHPEPCFVIRPLSANTTVFHEPFPVLSRIEPVSWVQELVADFDLQYYRQALEHLVSFPTRLSTTNHFRTAAEWTRSQLKAIGFDTCLQSINLAAANTYNVIANRQGSGAEQREVVLIVAHLDSVNSSGGPSASAPGADDNASGCAAVLTIANALKDYQAHNDLRLLLFGGEEQGLYGSTEYVRSLTNKERYRIRAVVNMDMIASLNTPSPTVLLEGGQISCPMIARLSEAATTYTSLAVQTSFHPYASDHVPFISAGIPAVLTIEGADGANDNIHTSNDKLEYLNEHLAAEIVKMNLAFAATELQKQKVATMNKSQVLSKHSLPPLSGRYSYGGGVGRGRGASVREYLERPPLDVLNDPIYDLYEPIYRAPESTSTPNSIGFTLHIDIDGNDPLDVVSGTLAVGTNPSTHFLGRVTENTVSCGTVALSVQDLSLTWPGTSTVIENLKIRLLCRLTGPQATVEFIAHGRSFGPFKADRESPYFRDVEFEVDCEDGAVDVEPFNTLTHPDRPADLREEDLTLETAFARSGIKVTRSLETNVIDTSEAGSNNRWNQMELHDAMESHWSGFHNQPQWKMWIFLAQLADDDGLGGIMFDANIAEPGGVDRQGTALFTKSPFFHSVSGKYIMANPPEAEAVKRELFFNLIHESGHAFNLAHSFQKTHGAPWQAPSWLPMQSDSQALSWMNYPDQASPGLNATWFYDRFRFRFDDAENLFLRHAPEKFVQMGAEDWFNNHGRVTRGSLDRRLQLSIRGLKSMVEFGEPVVLELKLKNACDEPMTVHQNLDVCDGFVELAVTNPSGVRRPFIPIFHTRMRVENVVLEPGNALYQSVKLAIGQLGCPFKQPGPYRIEASYVNTDGGTAAGIMQLWVKPPANYDDWPTVKELFEAHVGRVLTIGGSRLMEDVKERLCWVSKQVGKAHPIQHHVANTICLPLARPYKVLGRGKSSIKVLEGDPEQVRRTLEPSVHDPEAANTVGHIEFRRVVDIYTECAVETRKRTAARKAQENLLRLFEQRSVIPSVIDGIKGRVAELK